MRTSISAFWIALILVIFSWSISASTTRPPKIFNVRIYGARADGVTDDSKAFLGAWKDACGWSQGHARVVVPFGTYMLNSVTFLGPCSKKVSFIIQGTLKAPVFGRQFLNPSENSWIVFRYIDGLSLSGGGTLDGQGASAWKYNDCGTNYPNCRLMPMNLRLDFVTNSRIRHLKSINSKNGHINLFACQSLSISFIRLTAPRDSPNTDGIHIGNSTDIKIFRADIGTGDDCISMVSGSKNIDISEVRCGPGHGISIGSLGRGLAHEYVQNVRVFKTSFTDTQNGVRIKTFSPSELSLASDIVFQDLTMTNVNNPIIIDQLYCPTCSSKTGKSFSRVQIRNVTYNNIRGTSSSKVAVALQCSTLVPCKDVKLQNIDLRYNGPGGTADSACSHVHGTANGIQTPPGCIV